MLPLAVKTVLDGRGVTSVGDLPASTAMQVGDVIVTGTVGGLWLGKTLSNPPSGSRAKGLLTIGRIVDMTYNLNLYFLENSKQSWCCI